MEWQAWSSSLLLAIAIAVLYNLDLQQGTNNNATLEPAYIYAEFRAEVSNFVFLNPFVLHHASMVRGVSQGSSLRAVARIV